VLGRWPIRNKLLVGIALLVVILLTMSISSFQGTYAYRELVRSISSRAKELPLATRLSNYVADLRVTLADLDDAQKDYPVHVSPLWASRSNADFSDLLQEVHKTLRQYEDRLNEHEHRESHIGEPTNERNAVARTYQCLAKIEDLTNVEDWYLDHERTEKLGLALVELQNLATELPSYLEHRMEDLSQDVKTRYRSWIVITWFCAIAATTLLTLFIWLGYRWIFRPLRVLVKGSRRVAAGDFDYHIQIRSNDEMAELAEAMNAMTDRFRAVRDDLDHQVQIRTKQVVRSEQLASVGFLAAGVAHEINNPLASIALCAESLEGRLGELAPACGDDAEVVGRYLKMIQTEAFRCKEITEKLLDFSRLGEVKRQSADLRELIRGVIEMVRHLGKYQNRHIQFAPGDPAIVLVNAQEIKQVVLNLVTNALDSLDAGGTLAIELTRKATFAEMQFIDNGCGMTDEVLKHLFEPFFTRKRGGQGTGLGLSIVYRIVSDHGGQIEATSAGPGHGSQFLVTLPLAEANANAKPLSHHVEKEPSHRYQAA
jgi:two-component system, NtrC family, sensor kinase